MAVYVTCVLFSLGVAVYVFAGTFVACLWSGDEQATSSGTVAGMLWPAVVSAYALYALVVIPYELGVLAYRWYDGWVD